MHIREAVLSMVHQSSHCSLNMTWSDSGVSRELLEMTKYALELGWGKDYNRKAS